LLASGFACWKEMYQFHFIKFDIDNKMNCPSKDYDAFWNISGIMDEFHEDWAKCRE
jgi:hypothetical protein